MGIKSALGLIFFVFVYLFIYLFSVCWVHKTAMAGSDRKTNTPMNKYLVLPEKNNKAQLSKGNSLKS